MPHPVVAQWVLQAQAVQRRVFEGRKVGVSFPSAPGNGGLGRHQEEIVAAITRENLVTVITPEVAELPLTALTSLNRLCRAVNAIPPVRFSASLRHRSVCTLYDLAAAREVVAADELVLAGFSALHQIRKAHRNDMTVSLVAATSHPSQVRDRHALAYRQYPIERPWGTRADSRRALKEISEADRILVSTPYVRDSFIEAGIAASKLELFPLTPHPRFVAEPVKPRSATFDIVYAGALTVEKGTPLLVDAFRAVAGNDLRLKLVGGWGGRGMRQFLEQAMADDRRIEVTPGDPLPAFRSASLAVHPSYQDGCAYSVLEALACKVPVIVSEDTGAKERVCPGVDGWIVPTGSREALVEAIRSCV